MAWIQAYRRLREIVVETTPVDVRDVSARFSIDESEPNEDGPRHSSRTVRMYPLAFGTNANDQTPGNRRTFVDLAVEVYYRPNPRNRTRVLDAMGSDYEALRDAFMDTLNWDSSTSGIIALNVGGLEIQPADVTYQEAGTVLALTLSVEYEDPQ
jgi:hypothetical protein